MKRYPLTMVRVTDINSLIAVIYRDQYRRTRRLYINDLPERHYKRLIRALNNLRVSVDVLDYIELTYYPR